MRGLARVALALGAGATAGLVVSSVATKAAQTEYAGLVAAGRAELRRRLASGRTQAQEDVARQVSLQVDAEMRRTLERTGLRRDIVDRAWAIAQRLGLG